MSIKNTAFLGREKLVSAFIAVYVDDWEFSAIAFSAECFLVVVGRSRVTIASYERECCAQKHLNKVCSTLCVRRIYAIAIFSFHYVDNIISLDE